MNDILEPPLERDLPPAHQADLRARLMAAIAPPEPHPARRNTRHTRRPRLAFAGALAVVGVVLAVVAGVATLGPWHRDHTETLAYSGGEIPPEVQRAADQCLADNGGLARRLPPDPANPWPSPDSLRLVNFLRRDGRVLVIFLSDTTIATCSNDREQGGRSAGFQPRTPWLRGPVEIDRSMSTDEDGGGEVFDLLGRASSRVGRIVLDHGNGRTTEANLADGTFTLINDGPVRTGHATLISYDRRGAVIDRRAAWRGEPERTCYTDPAGTVVLQPVAEPASDQPCQPAEAWR